MNKLIESLATFFYNQIKKESYLTLLLIPIIGFIGIFVCIYEEMK
jgi:hypothetical protein